MQHRATTAFWQQYRALSQEIRDRSDKQLALLKANSHPSLQFKHYNSREWESATARKCGPPASP
jgi:hypothetical protein